MDLCSLPPVATDVPAPPQPPAPKAPTAPFAAAVAHMVAASYVKNRRHTGTHLLSQALPLLSRLPHRLYHHAKDPGAEIKAPGASTPAAATPSAAPLKKKQVVKRKAKPPVVPETTTIDPQAAADFAEHNVFDNMTQRYKT
jgi:hypothetical protein